MTSEGYKAAKEAFVTGTSGSSLSRINLISSVSLSSLFLHHSYYYIAPDIINNFFLQWLLIVLPILAAVSSWLGSSISVALLSATLFLNGLLIMYSNFSRRPNQNQSFITKKTQSAVKIQGLTIYRSQMLLLTSICISAVDFPLFPRELAKCESFGVSLMDIGVGSFVFSQGIVSAKGYIALTSKSSNRRNSTSYLKELWHLLSKTLPLFVLGLLRILLVKGVEYPEHASEYGTHWNFFFTLFLVPIFESLLRPILSLTASSYRSSGPALAGLFISLAHTLMLTHTPLQNWALTAPRVDLLTHNKEGVVSLPGYLALHLLGLSTGIALFSSYSNSKNDQHRLEDQNKTINKEHAEIKPKFSLFFGAYDHIWDKHIILLEKLFGASVLFWGLFWVVCVWFDGRGVEGVSRRLANLSYILWTSAYNTTFIFFFVLVDLFFLSRSVTLTSFEKGQSFDESPQQSPLLNAINKHGLVFFLLANVLTGLTNLLLPTLYASDYVAVLIWYGYTMACCGIVWIMEQRFGKASSRRSVAVNEEADETDKRKE